MVDVWQSSKIDVDITSQKVGISMVMCKAVLCEF